MTQDNGARPWTAPSDDARADDTRADDTRADSSVDELSLLFDHLAPGVYRYAGRVGNTALAQWAQGRGWRAFHIAAAHISDKRTFLDAAARALRFPAYVGRNWDAFEEALRDLPGARAAGYLLILEAPSAFAAAAPQEWQTALTILGEAATFWEQQGAPFYVLLRRTAGSAAQAPLLR